MAKVKASSSATALNKVVLVERIGRSILFGYFLFMPLLFTQATVEGFEFPKFLALLLTAFLLLTVAIVALPGSRLQVAKRELRQPLSLAGLAFVASALVSTFASSAPSVSFFGHYLDFAGSLTFASYLILFLAVRQLIRTPEQRLTLLVAPTLSVGAVLFYGWLQALDLDFYSWSETSAVGQWQRPFATLGHPNLLAAFLVLATPLAWWRCSRGSSTEKSLRPFLALAAIGMIALTLSRGAWLGAIAAGLVALALQPKWTSRFNVRWLVVSVVILSATVVGMNLFGGDLMHGVNQRLSHFFDGSGRLAIWQTSWTMFKENPILGCGPDLFQQTYGRYGGIAWWRIEWGRTPSRAHNDLLQILATQGTVGALALLFGLIAFFITFRRAWYKPDADRFFLIAVASALAGFLVTELLGFGGIAAGSLAVMLLGIVSRLGETTPAAATSSSSVRRFGFGLLVVQIAMVQGVLLLAIYLVVRPLAADVLCRRAEGTTEPFTALALHESAVRWHPREPLYWHRLALFAEQEAHDASDSDEKIRLLPIARISFRAAIERDPEDGNLYAGLGRTLGELARLKLATAADAYAAFDRSLQLDPANVCTYVSASLAALLLGDAEQSLHYTNAGLKLYPHFGPLHEQVVKRWLLLNRPEEARSAFAAAFEADWSRNTEDLKRLQEIESEFRRRLKLPH